MKMLLICLGALVATLLGATVLREPTATAAQTVGATIVGPLDAAGNVKVHEQGTASVASADETQLLLERRFSDAGQSETLDVSAYRTIRVSFSDCGRADGSPVYLDLYELTPAGGRYPVDRITPSCGGELSRTFDVPGRTIQLSVGDLARPQFSVAVYGRAN